MMIQQPPSVKSRKSSLAAKTSSKKKKKPDSTPKHRKSPTPPEEPQAEEVHNSTLINLKNQNQSQAPAPEQQPEVIKKVVPIIHQSIASTDNPTLLSTLGKEAHSTNPVTFEQTQRSASVPPTGGLPLLVAPKMTLPNIGKFRSMAYNRNYILNFDGDASSRVNKEYISGHYKQLTQDAVLPQQQSLTYKSLRQLDFQQSPHKRSFNFMERQLNSNSEIKPHLATMRLMPDPSMTTDMAAFQQSARLQSIPEFSHTLSHDTKLPNLFDTSIVASLNQAMMQESNAMAARMIAENERRHQRKATTKELIGMADYDSHAGSENPFKPKGLMEKQYEPSQASTDSRKTRSYINSSVYHVLEDNYSLYMQELQDAKIREIKKKAKVRATLVPADRQRFDMDEDYARTAIIQYELNLEENQETLSKQSEKQPERDFDRLRARIKLHSIKKFSEDQQRKKELEAKQAKAKADRLTSAQRKRVKHEPIKRRRSFTETQLRFEDGIAIYEADKQANQEALLRDSVIATMKSAKRYPIPEQLLNKPKNYWLKIDSVLANVYNIEGLVETANLRPTMFAPQNSDVSEDNYSIGSLSPVEIPSDEEKAAKAVEVVKDRTFDKTQIDLSPFSLERMVVFPHKFREGDVPVRVLIRQEIGYLTKIHDAIKQSHALPKYQYSHDRIQTIFEYYCNQFKVSIFDLRQHIVPTDNNRIKLSFRHFQLNENQCKAIACTMPFMYKIQEVEFIKNGISDLVSPLFLFGAFCNPDIVRFAFQENYARHTFKNTFDKLQKENKSKFRELSISHSCPQIEVMEHLSKSFNMELTKLNIAGCGLNLNACRILNAFLLKSDRIKELNLSSCKLANQGARYIVDALIRNVTIRHLNIAYNDFSSSIYEFSIKIASMLTRHPTLLHCDLSQCAFKREECMFLVLAMSLSKNLLAVHMTGNDLSYYERIFMRALISARVDFNFKHDAQRSIIERNKERYQVMQMATKEYIEPEVAQYLERFEVLETARQGLDFEIDDMLKDPEIEKAYQNLQDGTKLDDLPPDSKLARLINKIMTRQREMNAQHDELRNAMKLTGPQVKAKLALMGPQGGDLSPLTPLKSGASAKEQAFYAQEAQKLQRQRQRAELEAVKGKKERSAGEMALLFMGINQVAYDLLIENPMTGYMNEIIYTRQLGHDDIEQGQFWSDNTQCYICLRYDKQVITLDPELDQSQWAQKITKIEKLQFTVKNLVNQAEEADAIQEAKKKEEYLAFLKYEKERKRALGEESSSSQPENEEAESAKSSAKPAKQLALTSDQQTVSFEDALQEVQKSKSLKIDLKPAADMSSSGALKSLGPQMLSPKFGGMSGITPMAEPTRRISELEDEAKRSKKLKAISSFADVVPIAEQPANRESTPLEKVQRPGKREFNTEHPLAPKTLSMAHVQAHIFPEKFAEAEDFNVYEHTKFETPPGSASSNRAPITQGEHDNYMHAKKQTRYGGAPGGFLGLQGIGKKKGQPAGKGQSIKDLTKVAYTEDLDARKPPSPHASVTPSIITSVENYGKRKRGEPQKIKRTIFMQGVVYVIEEEVYSDSDNSSVYTSEDDFEEDNAISRTYVAMTADYDARMADLLAEKRKQSDEPVMTEKEKRLEKLGIVREDKKELTEAQKEYKSKIWPKYYIPHLKEEKAVGLDKVGAQLDIRLNAPKEGEKHNNRGPEIRSGPRPDQKVIWIIGSFNDWMPFKLKTKRQLIFEKTNPDEPIPKATFVLDNKTLMYANYMAPGRHYFYFVTESGTIFLNPNYQIVRFKTTNVFLNLVVVRPRTMDFDSVNVVRGGDEEEQIFIKDRSIFRDYKDDTKKYLQKVFDQDMQYTKLQRAMKGDEETVEDIKKLLFNHFVKINNIFLYQIGKSSYPTISMNDFTSWARKTEIFDDKVINLATLDRILITTNVAMHGLISSAERDLNRYEFLEIIVRLSNALYKESGVVETTPQAVYKLLHDNIYPHSEEVDGEHFRRFHCYNVKVNEILQKNTTVLRRIYDTYTHSKKKFIRPEECAEFILKTGLNVSAKMVGIIFAESMQTILDTIIDQDRPNQMKYVEFLVFLTRCSYQHYVNTPYENEAMYLKLEKTIPIYLNVINLQPQFLFYEEFEYKPVVRKKKGRKAPKEDATGSVVAGEKSDPQASKPDGPQQPGDDQKEAEQPPEEEEDEDDDDESEGEDLGECIVLEEGKYQLSAKSIAKLKAQKEEREAERERRAREKEVAEAIKAQKLQDEQAAQQQE